MTFSVHYDDIKHVTAEISIISFKFHIAGQTAPRHSTGLDGELIVHKEEIQDMDDDEETPHPEVIIAGLS